MTQRSSLLLLLVPLVAFSALPASGQGRTPLNAQAVQRLQQDAGADVSIHPGTGTARFVRVPRGASIARRRQAQVSISAQDRRERARGFLRDHADVFGVDPDGALVDSGAVTDAHGWNHVTFKQVYRGVPVLGGELRTHFDDSGELAAVTGVAVPNIALNASPSVGREAAGGAALARVAEDGGSGLGVRGARLYVYRTGLFKGVDGENHLAWEIEVGNGRDVREFVYIDAHSAKMLDRINGIHDAMNRRAYDGAFLPTVPPTYPGTPFWVEGDAFPTASSEANNMLLASKETYDFFMNAHGRDSFDAAGATMDSIFNRGYDCPNASWNGAFISFCQGLTTDDVTGHEWGHAYTQYTHDLIYQWQPGALNESYSDIWGEIVDLINGRGTDSPGGARTLNSCSSFSPPRAELVVNAPSALAGSYPAQSAAFGPPLSSTGVTGLVVLANDGSTAGAGGTVNDACEPLVNAAEVAGKIALVYRGVCTFNVKVKNAQLAGAVAVIVGNNVSSGLPGMGGVDATVTIPSLGITQGDANAIRAALPGVNVTLRRGGSTDTSVRWLMGEDSTAVGLSGALRDMWTPNCYGDPGKVTDTAYYVCSTADGGGVHTNSGVPNHTFALIVDGGAYNGETVPAIGLTKAAHIYYRAASVYQHLASDFTDHADSLEQSCSDLTGLPLNALTGGPSAEVITAADCGAVATAIAATELRTSPDFCNFQPMLSKTPPDRCETGTKETTLFFEGFESNPRKWTVSHTAVNASFTPRDWIWTGDLPDRPGRAFFGIDPNIGSCAPDGDESGVLHLDSRGIPLPSGVVAPRLTFDHWVSTELGFDGGQLLVSVDDGPWTQVARQHFTFNPYNLQLATAAQGNTNPMAGQFAFSGSDGGTVLGSWGRSHVNLAPYAGPDQSLRLRFDLGTDGCAGAFGWFVDDVNVYTCTPGTLPTISINDVSIEEGDHGFTDAVFTVSLSHAYHQTVSVKYEVKPGTARPDDYAGGGIQTVEVEPMDISAAVRIRIRGDKKLEGDETFFVTLSKAKNSVIGDGSGTGTILNDDGPITTAAVTTGGGSQK